MPLAKEKSDQSTQARSSSESVPYQQPNRNHLTGRFFSLESGLGINSIALALLVAAILLLVSVLGFAYWQQHPDIVKENGLLEAGQDVLLLFAWLISLLRFWQIRSATSLNRELLLALSFSTLIILLREVDIDKLGSSALWDTLEKVVRAVAAVALLGFIFSLRKKIKWLFTNFANLLKTPLVILVTLGALLYACSWPLDKNIFFVQYSLSQFYEEIIELNACILFLFAALARGVTRDKPLP